MPRLLAAFALLLVSPACGAEQTTLGHSVEGRPIVARSLGDGDDVVLVVASIHGSEPAGTPLVERLDSWLADSDERLDGRRVVIVPIANPDGFARRERFNANGVDLNRNFPADNRTPRKTHGDAPLSEPESVALMRALQTYDPLRVVSIHQPLECVDYDGPARELAEAMAAAIDARLPVRKLGGRPGSMGSYVGVTLARPIVTLELKRGDEQRSADDLWADYGAALVAFVRGE